MSENTDFVDSQQNINNSENEEKQSATVLQEKSDNKNADAPEEHLSQKQLKEIAKLHKECAKYRTALNTSITEKANLEKLFQNLKADFDSVSKQNFNMEIIRKLEKEGCLKPSLVIKDIPEDCQNFDEFLSEYKKNNGFLFKQEKSRHGYSFRGLKSSNYSASQQMNNYIRSALGR